MKHADDSFFFLKSTTFLFMNYQLHSFVTYLFVLYSI